MVIIISKVNYYTISVQICSFRIVVAMSLQQIMPRIKWPKCLKANDCQKLKEKREEKRKEKMLFRLQ